MYTKALFGKDLKALFGKDLKALFGKDLKERILMKQDVSGIGHWVYSIYLKYIEEIDDPNFDDILLTLNTMEDGPEFAFTYEELNKIADDLIAGRDVKLG